MSSAAEKIRVGTKRIHITDDQIAANAGNRGNAPTTKDAVALSDFRSYMPTHQYIYVPTGELWPASSVNSRISPVGGSDGKPIRASEWLDTHHAVEQMTWAPGEPTIIEDRLVSQGGYLDRAGARVYNLYRPPTVTDGDPLKAGAWVEHVHRVYPTEADHIIKWLAHRVQRPGEKINHGIVLGGAQGIGKDSTLEPVKYAVGPWNFVEVSPAHLLGRFNGFVKSVILRISEARDLGEINRFAFYDHMKIYTAAPPDVLRCDEKHLREHAVLNVCGVVITSNYKTDGIYLPPDDRRHFVAWSPLTKDDFDVDYWQRIYTWYGAGGRQDVAAYLATLDLSDFDPKTPPPKTPAFWVKEDANRAPEDAELAAVIDAIGNTPALHLAWLVQYADESFRDWLQEHRNRRQIPHRLEAVGYTPVRNVAAKDGLWKVSGKRMAIYALRDKSVRDQIAAAAALCRGDR